MVFVCLFMGSNSRGQSNSQTEVIKQSVALKELQGKIPFEIQQKMIDILILNSGINYVFDQSLKVNNKSVKLISNQELLNHKGEGYFIFNTIDIEANKAKVVYEFVFQNNGDDIVIPVSLLFEETAEVWKVTSMKFKK